MLRGREIGRAGVILALLGTVAACAGSAPAGPRTAPCPPVATPPTTRPRPSTLPTTTTRPPPITTEATATTAAPVPASRPAPIQAAAWLGVAGDGIWKPAGRAVGPAPVVYTTTMHHTGVPVGVAWMDTSRLRFALYAGTSQPPGAWANDGAVPSSA